MGSQKESWGSQGVGGYGTELFHGGDRVVLHGQNSFGIVQGVALVLEHLREHKNNYFKILDTTNPVS